MVKLNHNFLTTFCYRARLHPCIAAQPESVLAIGCWRCQPAHGLRAIQIEEYRKPMPERTDYQFGLFTVSDFLSAEECAEWIRTTEEIGYADAPITTARGPLMVKDVRNNDRVMMDDPATAAELWRRAKPYVPSGDPLLRGEPMGLNERLRFYRYTVGQRFDWHSDGHFARPDGSEISRLTFMVYLNEGFDGGETNFWVGNRTLPIVPKTGMALFFMHRFRHQGAEVRGGVKYVLRSDVMFTLVRDPDAVG